MLLKWLIVREKCMRHFIPFDKPSLRREWRFNLSFKTPINLFFNLIYTKYWIYIKLIVQVRLHYNRKSYKLASGKLVPSDASSWKSMSKQSLSPGCFEIVSKYKDFFLDTGYIYIFFVSMMHFGNRRFE